MLAWIVLQQELGPNWKELTYASMTLVGSLIVLIGSLTVILFKICYKHIKDLEVKVADADEKRKNDIKDLGYGIGLQIKAARRINNLQYVNMQLMLCQLMKAVQSGNSDLLDPEGLFKANLEILKQEEDL